MAIGTSLLKELLEAIQAAIIAESGLDGEVYVSIKGKVPAIGDATAVFAVCPVEEPEPRISSSQGKEYKPLIDIYAYVALTSDRPDGNVVGDAVSDNGIVVIAQKLATLLEFNLLTDLVEDAVVTNKRFFDVGIAEENRGKLADAVVVSLVYEYRN